MIFPSRNQLIRDLSLTRTDQMEISKRRGDPHRLGFAYQLGFVRVFQRFPVQQPLEICEELLSFVAGAPGNRYWGALSLSAMMARARWVRSSFSLGVNRMSPLTQRLISRVAISVMRICSPRSVMEMAPEISIACWHSRMDIVGGEGGMRGRSASSMMARDFLVSSSWLARGSRISPQTQCFP